MLSKGLNRIISNEQETNIAKANKYRKDCLILIRIYLICTALFNNWWLWMTGKFIKTSKKKIKLELLISLS